MKASETLSIYFYLPQSVPKLPSYGYLFPLVSLIFFYFGQLLMVNSFPDQPLEWVIDRPMQ